MADNPFCEPRENWPDRNPEVQEALSRRYADETIILLPLRTGRIAVFNAARELCGIIDGKDDERPLSDFWSHVWHPPAKAPERKTEVDLKDLGLL